MTEPIKPAVNYAVAERDLKYYIFDWDNNILHMPTLIHLERRTERGDWVPHAVSTAVFSVIRTETETYRPPQGDWELAFQEFRDIDVADTNVFIRDTRAAIDRIVSGEEAAAPSFERFRQVLIEGRLFAIVTARGHDPEVIRSGVEYFIDTALTEDERAEMQRNLRGYLELYAPGEAGERDEEVLGYYLSHNKYHGVMSPSFQALMGTGTGSSPNTEVGKQFAIRDFLNHVIAIARERGLDKPISVGFSDDDVHNVQAVEAYIRTQLGTEFPGVKFVVYYTDDPGTQNGRKVVVRGQLTLDLT
jgi:hypothetical protein